jgi:UDP-glucose 4-epimerase
MLILSTANDIEYRQHVIVIFGEGLIGSSVVRHILDQNKFVEKRIKIDWEIPEIGDAQLADAFNYIQSLVSPEDRSQSPMIVSILWAAGRAGFDATQEETEQEYKNFQRVLEFGQKIVETSSTPQVHFHMTSSAGGLFEGQRDISLQSIPNPLRNYGILKLKQEQLLLSTRYFKNINIYRISSVYGPLFYGHRQGLITVMIENNLTGKPVRIVGRMNTLRDYVWAGDVATFIARKLIDRSGSGQNVLFLVSGNAVSIEEVIAIVEKITLKRTSLVQSDVLTNSQDITFSRSVFPDDWHPIDLSTSIARICQSVDISKHPRLAAAGS